MRDLKVRYKRSMLGYVWALLDPLLMMCVFLLVFGLFLEIQIERYPIFLLSGLVPWNFFAGVVQQSVDSLTRNRGLIEKLYCPREIFPLAVVLSNAVNMGFNLLVLFAITAFDGTGFALACTLLAAIVWILTRFFKSPRFRTLACGLLVVIIGLCLILPGFAIHFLLLALAVCYLIALALGLALMVSCLNVFFADITYIVQVLLRLGLFLCPIFWTLENGRLAEHHLRLYLFANPLAVTMQMFRSVVLQYPCPGAEYLLVGGAVAVLTVTVGYCLFKRLENSLVKRI